MTEVVTLDTSAINLPFTAIELTESINQLPTPFGQMTADGYFPAEPLASQFVEINIENGVLSALPVTGDGPPTVAKHGTAAARIFKVPTIKHLDNMLAKDILNMLTIVSRSKKPETAVGLMNKRLQTLKNKFNVTWELMRMSSAKGAIVDGSGASIYDLFDAFEITKKIVYFNLSDETTDVQAKCDLIWQLVTQDLSDEVMNGIEVRCSRSFFNALIGHAKVEKFWLNAVQAQQLVNIARGTDGGYRPRQFEFGNIVFKEYSAAVPMWGGSNTLIIAANKGHAYPTGTMNTHTTYIAPPDDIAALNGGFADVNDAIHITTERMKHGEGIEILGKMNALPLWRRPALLVECDAGNSGSSTVPLGE